ncbi:MAG: CvpA family protein [Acidobacteriaceae bacterium]
MNPLDWLMVVVLAFSIVRATIRGFFREAFSLGGLILGVLCACWFYRQFAAMLGDLIPSPVGAQFAAFLLLLFGIVILFSLLGRLLSHTASALGLGFVDRLLGAMLGFCRGVVVCFALLLVLTAFRPAAPWVDDSRLEPYFLRAAHALSFLMPKDLGNRLASGLNRFKHTRPDWIK